MSANSRSRGSRSRGSDWALGWIPREGQLSGGVIRVFPPLPATALVASTPAGPQILRVDLVARRGISASSVKGLQGGERIMGMRV
eukprot:97858-Chlamydomonas_euryale.AAC.8